jgi:hypothetical protein
MAKQWLFANALPKDGNVNRVPEGPRHQRRGDESDRKSIAGVILGGERVDRDHATTFVRNHLAQPILMDRLAAGWRG